MKQVLLLWVFSLSFLLLLASIVEDTCTKVNENRNATESKERYDFCITSFQTAPKSSTADKYELAVICLELCLANHTYILTKAKKLQQQSDLPPEIKKCIDVCVAHYGLSISDLHDAIGAAQKKLSFGRDIASATSVPMTCKEAFEEGGQKDLLATENYNAFTLNFASWQGSIISFILSIELISNENNNKNWRWAHSFKDRTMT